MLTFDLSTEKLVKIQQVSDLRKRSITGTFIYVLIWFVIASITHTNDPTFNQTLITYSLLILASAAMRIIIVYTVYKIRSNVDLSFILLVIGAGINGLVWGLLFCSSYLHTNADHFQEVLLISTVGIAAGSALTLSCSKLVIYTYLSCLLLPAVLIEIFIGSQSELTKVIPLLIVFYIGLLSATSLVTREYIKSVTQNIKLEELSSIDELSGVHNRRYFNRKIEAEIAERKTKEHADPLSLILIDLDDFKSINDSFGHLVGDRCIHAAAVAIYSSVIPYKDTVARLGGDEFVVLLPATDENGVEKVATRILSSLRDSIINVEGHCITLSASLGAYTLQKSNKNITQEFLLEKADKAVYRSKSMGGDCVSL